MNYVAVNFFKCSSYCAIAARDVFGFSKKKYTSSSSFTFIFYQNTWKTYFPCWRSMKVKLELEVSFCFKKSKSGWDTFQGYYFDNPIYFELQEGTRCWQVAEKSEDFFWNCLALEPYRPSSLSETSAGLDLSVADLLSAAAPMKVTRRRHRKSSTSHGAGELQSHSCKSARITPPCPVSLAAALILRGLLDALCAPRGNQLAPWTRKLSRNVPCGQCAANLLAPDRALDE